MSKDHTIITIAHRLSTIQNSDNIYLIENGQILAEGKHNQLIKNNKNYEKLYKN